MPEPRYRTGPYAARPHFVITRFRSETPRLFRVTSQNNRSRRLYGTDMTTDQTIYIPMDEVIATHEDEVQATACFAVLMEQLPAIDRSVSRARQALSEAEHERQMEIRKLAMGRELA